MAINSDFESCIAIHGNMATDISSTTTSIEERQISIHHLKKKLVYFLARVEFSNKIRWNPIPILVPGSRKTSDRGNLRGKHLLVMFNIFTFSIETSDMIVIPCYSHKYKIYLFTGCIPIND